MRGGVDVVDAYHTVDFGPHEDEVTSPVASLQLLEVALDARPTPTNNDSCFVRDAACDGFLRT